MVSFLKKLFAENKPGKIIEHADPQTRMRIATCAVLVEMANADDNFTKEEKNRIISILEKRFQLDRDEARDLIGMAEEELEGSIDLYRFTNTIKNGFSVEERLMVLEEIWNIVYADGELSGREDTLAHKLSFLLGLTHKQMIDAKLKAKNRR